jgi:hypothetical protein
MIRRKTVVLENSVGYDGQFFYYLAHDPFLNDPDLLHLDAPAYRSQRILYPLLAWMFALGFPALIPGALVAVNIAAVSLGTFWTARILAARGRPPGRAIFYAALPGLVLCVFRDLAGPVALAFAIGAFYHYDTGRIKTAALCLAAAFLARENWVLLWPCFLLDAAWIRKSAGRFAWTAASIVPFAAFETLLYFRFDTVAFRAGTGNFAPPFTAAFSYAAKVFRETGNIPLKLFTAVFLAVMFYTVLLAFFEAAARPGVRSFSFAVFALFSLFFSEYIWVEPWSFARVILPLGGLMILNEADRGGRRFLFPLYGNAVLFVLVLWWVRWIP